MGDSRARELRAQLDRTATIGVDESVIDAYATLVAKCRRAGHALQQKQHTADRWIAACAIAKDVELLAGDGIFAGAPRLRLVAKLVAGSNVLRDSGVDMYEYIEQPTYLLFLKMAEERATRKLNPERVVPDTYA